mmetsp:Transcript_24255/g.61720  ORF Transcript_24255/g.61720 Transcript_24255/m.61720 type:complete len:210 (-) Transcript_24255:930-1559(-)
MSNLAGNNRVGFGARPITANAAVEEWSTRVGMQMPGEVTAPRNTLRGHPQPWRTRRPGALDDTGPLRHSTMRANEDPRLTTQGLPGVGHGQPYLGDPADKSSSTAALLRGEWEGRLTLGRQPGMRGSIAPNWQPREQADVTKTGSVHLASWTPGTEPFIRPGTLTLPALRAQMDRAKALPEENTWSTAAIHRTEWEGRLDKQGVAHYTL